MINDKPAAKPHVAASRQEVRTMANHHAAVLPLALDFGPDPGPAGAMYTELLLPEVSQGPGRDLRRPPPRRRRGRRRPRRGQGGAERGAPGAPQAADRRGRVDVAICAVLRDGPLRRSEAADCWPSGRPTLARRPRSSGPPTDRSAGGSAPRRSTPGRS